MAGGELIWLFCEWDYFLPHNMSGFYWGKPIYISNTGIQSSALQYRIINDHLWIDLKWKADSNEALNINYDNDIIQMLDDVFAIKPILKSKVFPGFIGISPERLEDEIGSHSNPNVQQIASTLSYLAKVLEVEISQLGVIGSQVLAIQGPESDLDIVVNLCLNKMPEFFCKVWRIKKRFLHLQRAQLGMYYPYKLFLDNCPGIKFGIDLFPKAVDIGNHPLYKSERWNMCETNKQRRKFEVLDSRFSHEGWPMLLCKNDDPVVILCNGFRGVFTQGEVFTSLCVDRQR